jgi:hypothetical protein
MMPLDTSLKGATAVLCFSFGALVLAANPRRAPNQFLAFFFFLLAGNQVAETFRSLAALAGDAAGAAYWYRIASVCAALDPFMLYYFASLYPHRSRLNRGPALAAVLAPSLVLVAAATSWPGFVGHAWVPVAFAGYTALVYGAVLVHAMERLADRPDEAPQALLVPALFVAALPVAARGVSLLDIDETVAAEATVGLYCLVALAVLWWARGRPAVVRRAATLGLVLAGVLTLLLQGYLAMIVPGVRLDGSFSYSAPLRWFVVGGFVSVALLRFQMLGMSLPMRRLAARILVGLAFLAAGLALVMVTDGLLDEEPRVSVTELLLLSALVLASQGFRSLVDRIALRVYGVPLPGDVAGAIETYRAALVEAHERGDPSDPAVHQQLLRLRSDLGLDERTAAVLARMVEAGPSTPLAPGQRIGGRYVVQRLLGRGGAGRAFLARDELLQREVVLKEVDHDEEGATALHEARLAGQLQHPNVLTVHDVLPRKGASLLVTEYLSGGSLADRLERDGALEAEEALAVVDGVLAGLSAAHSRGVVHRDLKPANVLFTQDGTPKVADFGIARMRRGVTVAGFEPDAFVGTPGFMAPEQQAGRLATPAADVYAAGLLLRSAALGALPTRVEEVLRRALEPDPSRRWSSAAEMRQALARARSGAVHQQGAADADDVAGA